MSSILLREKILNFAKKNKGVIYGARAINPQLPSYLRKETKDYDIYVQKPKKSAQKLLEQLKKTTGKKLELKKAKNKGTYKIKLNDETLVDLTQLKRRPKTKKILGDEYYDIKSIKQSTARLSKKPSAEFRREKDLSTLRRIEELERIDKDFNF